MECLSHMANTDIWPNRHNIFSQKSTHLTKKFITMDVSQHIQERQLHIRKHDFDGKTSFQCNNDVSMVFYACGVRFGWPSWFSSTGLNELLKHISNICSTSINNAIKKVVMYQKPRLFFNSLLRITTKKHQRFAILSLSDGESIGDWWFSSQ